MQPDASQIAKTILDIEDGLALDHVDWRMGDAHLWPLYRMEIYRLLFAAQAGTAPARSAHTLGPMLKHTLHNGTRARKGASTWLVSDGISFSRFDDIDFDRFCDPIYAQLERLGVKAVLIDRSSPRPRASRLPMRWWAPLTQRAKLAGMVLSKLRPDRRHDRLIHAIRDAATRRGLELPPLDSRRFDAMARAVMRLSYTIERRMRADDVAVMFLVSYYDVGGYAYTLAAHRCGAMSIDVQHGVTGEYHVGYADWHKEPSPGFGMLPDGFWCWTGADAALIERWARQQDRPARLAVVGGHPFMESWRAQEIPQSSEAQTSLAALLKAAGARPCVLVTLQPGLINDTALGPLLEIWAQAPDIQWWIRLHPMALADRPAIEQLLLSHSVKHWDIAASSRLPLPSLLTHAKAHCTHSSSAVIEAELLEVPSLLWAEYGVALFKAQIASGIAYPATNAASFARQLASSCARASRSRRWSGVSPMQEALVTILKTHA